MMRCFTDAQELAIVERYAARESMQTIANSLGTGYWNIRNALIRNRAPIRAFTSPCRIDETVLDHAETNPEAAYVVGLWITDGCVWTGQDGTTRLSLGLSGDDGSHLVWVRDFFHSSHKLCYYQYRGGPFLKQPTVKLSFASSRLARAFSRYGVTPRKTMTAKVKHLTMNRHFWCGAVCGDGWITIASKKRSDSQLGLCGSELLMRQFSRFARRVSGASARVRRKGSIFQVSVSGRNAAALAQAIFGITSFALPRKLSLARTLTDQWGLSAVPTAA